MIGFVIIATALLIFSCDNRNQNSPKLSADKSTVRLIIRATIADKDLVYGSVYRTSTSRAFTITDFRYYLSKVVAIREDGSPVPARCSVLLVDPGCRNYDLGYLPAGSYKGLRFIVGLDSAVNHGDPTVFEAGNPLAIQTPSMHWDWNSGYLFMKIEGKVDTTRRGSAAPTTEFFYHIGMDRMKRAIELPVKFSVGKSSGTTIPIKFDVAAMLGCVDLQSEISTHSFDNLPLATRIADRWQSSFSVDQ